MGKVHPLRQSPPPDSDASLQPVDEKVRPVVGVRRLDAVTCGLCGARLSAGALRYRLVSPRSCDAPITVCYMCRRAALGEGYRPT
jgi:hypothetical protein